MWKAQPITEETGWVEIMDGDTYIGATRGPNSERNAKIMAAGKDMLEALKQIVEQHGQWNNGIWAANIARAEIAKAEGKQ